MTADVQRELAEALDHPDWCNSNWPGKPGCDCLDHRLRQAAALLPTVQALIDEEGKRAAAKALRKAAESAPVVRFDNGYPVRAVPVSDLLSFAAVLDRAAALDPSGAVDGAQT